METYGKCYVHGRKGSISYKSYFFPNYKFTGIPVKIQIGFFCGTWRTDSEIRMKDRGERIAKTIVNNNKVGGIFLPDTHLIRLLLVQDQTVRQRETECTTIFWKLYATALHIGTPELAILLERVYSVTAALEGSLTIFNKVEKEFSRQEY